MMLFGFFLLLYGEKIVKCTFPNGTIQIEYYSDFKNIVIGENSTNKMSDCNRWAIKYSTVRTTSHVFLSVFTSYFYEN